MGENTGCWINLEFDRLFRFATTSFDDQERDNATLRAFRLITEDVALIATSYNVEQVAVRRGLVAPVPGGGRSAVTHETSTSGTGPHNINGPYLSA